MSTNSPPSLAALVAPIAHRSKQLKVMVQPSEHEALAGFAAQAGVPPSTLARALIQAGIHRLAQEQAQQAMHGQQEAA
jgi:predicted HicB family RNase H-like nuclease